MKVITLAIATLLLAGCAPAIKAPWPKSDMYIEPTGPDTAKIRVLGFTDSTRVVTHSTCDNSTSIHGQLRDPNSPEGKSPITDKGYKKADLPQDGYPLDYYEFKVSSEGMTSISSSFSPTPGSICVLNSGWFKPEKGALYELRNKVDRNGRACIGQFYRIDEKTGKAIQQSYSKKTVDEILGCKA
ncbi:hypothetical protein PO369_13035 [Phytobacter diazotrophicus]|uniref:hypothetical protein n=1 Tax=Phytobacter diazotrophicus TaxID=395631 RepID=UPI002FFA9161|nr:hypothetical protein [Enterobacteriaceae bacterium]